MAQLKKDQLPTRNDVRFFRENGYWLAGQVLTEDELQDLRQAADGVAAGRDATGIGSMLRTPGVCSSLGAMAARLADTPEIRLWEDRWEDQPEKSDSSGQTSDLFRWRQNSIHWRCTVSDLLTAWVALDDVTPESGCPQVVPGSHRWGLLREDVFFQSDMASVGKQIEEEIGHVFTIEPCCLKAGEVLFFHCLTIHGNGPNRTDIVRRSLVIHLQPDHAFYIAGTPSDQHQCAMLLRRQGGKNGDLFRGDPWPVLFPTESSESNDRVPGMHPG